MSTDQLNFGFEDEFDLPHAESDEAYTTNSQRYPIISVVNRLFGEIGLDPTSNPEKSVPARHHFTREDNCLIQDWDGLGPVFMNPPYSTCLPFITKMIEEYHAGHTPEAICLILSTTATNKKVGPALRASSSALCMLHGRPPFRFGVGNRKGDHGTLTVPSVAFYLGKRPDKFCEAFVRLGTTAYTHPLDHYLKRLT